MEWYYIALIVLTADFLLIGLFLFLARKNTVRDENDRIYALEQERRLQALKTPPPKHGVKDCQSTEDDKSFDKMFNAEYYNKKRIEAESKPSEIDTRFLTHLDKLGQ